MTLEEKYKKLLDFVLSLCCRGISMGGYLVHTKDCHDGHGYKVMELCDMCTDILVKIGELGREGLDNEI